MSTRSPETDAYIAKSADFAQPILTKLRALFHKADPAIDWMAEGKPRNWRYMKEWR